VVEEGHDAVGEVLGEGAVAAFGLLECTLAALALRDVLEVDRESGLGG